MKFDVALSETSNANLSTLNRPKTLTLAEFEALEVSDAELRARLGIYDLEEAMMADPNCVDDEHLHERGMVPVHRFVRGLYSRELTIPPSTLVVGKRHAIEHIVMVTSGKCLCITERGYEVLEAPVTFISPAGEKRVVQTFEDSPVTWVTLHQTSLTDLDDIEKQVIIAEPARKEHYKALRQQKELTMNEVTS